MLGNVLIGQSGGPTAVINSSLAGAVVAARKLGAKKVYGMRFGIKGFADGRYVDMDDYLKNDIDTELLKRTPASFLGSCRFKLPAADSGDEVYEKIFKNLDKLDIRHVFYIGGNDSMDTIMKLSQYAAKIGSDKTFIGIPKTIDNDLAVTDHTPGFGSAAKYIAATMKELIRDNEVYDTEKLLVVEMMGRNAGWLAGSAALAKCDDCDGPDLIYLPEQEFDVNKFVAKVNELKKQKNSIVIAVSEGIHTSDGKYVCESLGDCYTDPFGHPLLSGTADCLAKILTQQSGIKARGVILNTIQRCASHIVSKTDVDEAFMAGECAVYAASNAETGKVAVFERISDAPYAITVKTYDVNAIANEEKLVPNEWITPDGDYVTEEFINYAKPLILGELDPYIVNGLPAHLRITVG